MTEYHVTWEIDLDAASPQEAAEHALAIQRDPDSAATVFDVTDSTGTTDRIDLEGADESGNSDRLDESDTSCAACGRNLDDEKDAIHAPTGRSYCRECFEQGQG